MTGKKERERERGAEKVNGKKKKGKKKKKNFKPCGEMLEPSIPSLSSCSGVVGYGFWFIWSLLGYANVCC